MQAKLILGLVIAILLIVFTIQNQSPVDVDLFFWRIEQVPMSIVIFSALLLGAFVVFFVGIRFKLRLNRALKGKDERIARLEHHIKAARAGREEKEGGTRSAPPPPAGR